MTSLVESSLTPTSDDIETRLSECIRKDLQLCQTKFSILNTLQKKNLRWFYILDKNARRPSELDAPEYRDIRESIIHLPMSDETLLRLTRVFESQAADFRFSSPEIRYCHNGGVIIYSVKPLR